MTLYMHLQFSKPFYMLSEESQWDSFHTPLHVQGRVQEKGYGEGVSAVMKSTHRSELAVLAQDTIFSTQCEIPGPALYTSCFLAFGKG